MIFSLTKISYNYNLVDIPNKRKKHFKPTAYIGGLAISISLIISIQLFDVVGDNSEISLGILTALYAIVPIILKIFAIFLMWNFKLNKSYQQQVQKTLIDEK